MKLQEMSLEELRDLSKQIGLELQKRIDDLEVIKREVMSNTSTHEFEFEASLRKEKPFVAKCYYRNGIERTFKNIPSSGNACSGKYLASEGEVLDIRDEDGRSYYTVYEGKLVKLCSYKEDLNICRIMQYLKGQMTFNVLLEILGLKEVNNSVISDLKDDD